MNKLSKILIAVLGAVDLVFSLFLPIAMSLILISTFELSNFNNNIVLGIGMLSTAYRAIDIAFLRG